MRFDWNRSAPESAWYACRRGPPRGGGWNCVPAADASRREVFPEAVAARQSGDLTILRGLHVEEFTKDRTPMQAQKCSRHGSVPKAA